MRKVSASTEARWYPLLKKAGLSIKPTDTADTNKCVGLQLLWLGCGGVVAKISFFGGEWFHVVYKQFIQRSFLFPKRCAADSQWSLDSDLKQG